MANIRKIITELSQSRKIKDTWYKSMIKIIEGEKIEGEKEDDIMDAVGKRKAKEFYKHCEEMRNEIRTMIGAAIRRIYL